MRVDDSPEQPRVSVVIPTVARPELRRAVCSVLDQTVPVHEVVVVADTESPLDLPDDARIVVLRVGPGAGGNAARRAGVGRSTGELVALLDDDDRWEPDKLERQLAAVGSAATSDDDWLSATAVREPSGRAWPRRLIGDGEQIPDYLFRKDRVRGGQGALHTSGLLFPRELAVAIPFDPELRFHQDTDWLIRVAQARPGVRVVQVPDPLTVLGEGAGSVSRGIRPAASLAWALERMSHLDRRTRGDFLLTVTYFQACRHREARVALRVLWRAFTWGRPTRYAWPSVLVLPLKVLTGRGIA